MKRNLVICTGVKSGKCKNKKCEHHPPHRVVKGPAYHGPGDAMRRMPLGELEQFKTTVEYCNRFGYCRNYKESKGPVAWPKAIEVKCE